MNKKMIRCFKNEINQVISIDLWTNKQIQYYIILGHIFVQILNLETGEIYRTFENLSDESNFQCCVIEKKNTRLDVSNQEALENKNEGNWILSQVSIETNDNLIVVIDKFTNALKSANEKVERLEKENFHLIKRERNTVLCKWIEIS